MKGKVIIVTGGTQGLGEGIARHLADLGAAGLITCGRNRENGEAVAAGLRERGCEAAYAPADLALEADCRRVVAARIMAKLKFCNRVMTFSFHVAVG